MVLPNIDISDLFPGKKRWEQGCNILSWAKRCVKKSLSSGKPYFLSYVKNSVRAELTRSDDSVPKKP